MTATGHAAVGALIAGKFSNPFLAFGLALLSHFICDLVPHWDSGTHWTEKSHRRLLIESIVDVLVSLLLAFIIYRYFLDMNNYLLLYTSVFAAQLPDWISGPYFILHIKFSVFEWMSKIQGKMNVRLDKPWGIVTQIVAVFGLYIILYQIF